MEERWSLRKIPGVGVVGCLLAAGHEHRGRKHYHALENDPWAFWMWDDSEAYVNENPTWVQIISFPQLAAICRTHGFDYHKIAEHVVQATKNGLDFYYNEDRKIFSTSPKEAIE